MDYKTTRIFNVGGKNYRPGAVISEPSAAVAAKLLALNCVEPIRAAGKPPLPASARDTGKAPPTEQSGKAKEQLTPEAKTVEKSGEAK